MKMIKRLVLVGIFVACFLSNLVFYCRSRWAQRECKLGLSRHYRYTDSLFLFTCYLSYRAFKDSYIPQPRQLQHKRPRQLHTNASPQSSAGNIVITYIFYNGAGSTEPDEYVEIRNDDTKSIQLQNWTLRDIANHNFTFPSFVMMPGKICRIYTNEFHPEWCGFSYGSSSAIWNNTGDCAYLNNSAATQVDSYCY